MLHLSAMMNAFKSSDEDIELRMRVLEDRLAGIPAKAIITTCKRFEDGEVEGQSKRTPPTVPEFVQEARRIADLQSYRDRPRLPALYRPRSHLAPFEIKAEQLRQKYADREILHTDISYDQWRAMRDKLPIGHTWIGALGGTIFGPKSDQQQEAAE